MKIAHIADAHLGYRQYKKAEREEDIFLAFKAAIDVAIEKEVRIFLIAGDLFHKRTVNPKTLLRAQEEIQRLVDLGITPIVIEGNHERQLRFGEESWASYIGRTSGIFLQTHLGKHGVEYTPYDATTGTGAYYEVDNVRFTGMGYYGASTGDAVRGLVKALEGSTLSHLEAHVVLLHAGHMDIMGGYGGGISSAVVALLNPYCDYLALGHLHKPYSIDGWVHNPGSLEVINRLEAEWPDRGVLIWDTAVGREPIRVPIKSRRKFLTINYDVSKETSVAAATANLADGIKASATGLLSGTTFPPVVTVTLSGVYHFTPAHIPTSVVEDVVKKELNPLYVSIKNEAVPVELANFSNGSEKVSRKEVETQVLMQLVSRDAKMEKHTDAWVGHIQDLLQMANEGKPDPERVIEELERFVDRISPTKE